MKGGICYQKVCPIRLSVRRSHWVTPKRLTTLKYFLQRTILRTILQRFLRKVRYRQVHLSPLDSEKLTCATPRGHFSNSWALVLTAHIFVSTLSVPAAKIKLHEATDNRLMWWTTLFSVWVSAAGESSSSSRHLVGGLDHSWAWMRRHLTPQTSAATSRRTQQRSNLYTRPSSA